MPDIAIDWLSFKAKKNYQKNQANIYDYLHTIFNFQDIKQGYFNKFNYMELSYEGCTILFNDSNEMLVQIHGTGCDYINFKIGIIEFIKYIDNLGVIYTRLDLCADDTQSILNMKKIENCYHKGLWRGSAREMSMIAKKDKDGYCKNGQTIYIGSRKSLAYIRIYDKAKQLKVDGHIIRVEIELHDLYCIQVIEMLINDKTIESIYRGLIYDRVQFLTYKDHNRHSEYDRVAKWWIKFLDNSTDKIKLKVNRDNNYYNTRKWIVNSAAPSLAMIMNKEGLDGVISIIQNGNSRIKEKHLSMMREIEKEREELY